MNMIDINEYILLSKEERKSHIDLSSPCLENICSSSRNLHHINRGILAWYLKTTIPSGFKIYLCHACNNGGCSNPQHHYWGTPKENFQDQVENGTIQTITERTINKYGLDKHKEMASAAGKLAWSNKS